MLITCMLMYELECGLMHSIFELALKSDMADSSGMG